MPRREEPAAHGHADQAIEPVERGQETRLPRDKPAHLHHGECVRFARGAAGRFEAVGQRGERVANRGGERGGDFHEPGAMQRAAMPLDHDDRRGGERNRQLPHGVLQPVAVRERVDREHSKREIGDRQHDEERQAAKQQRHDKCRFACIERHAGHLKRGECGDGATHAWGKQAERTGAGSGERDEARATCFFARSAVRHFCGLSRR